MNVEVFALCREAKLANNCFDVTGIFNRLWSERTPAVINNSSVALRLCFRPDEDKEGIRNIAITIVDVDGKEIDAITDKMILEYDDYPGFTADLCYVMKGVGLPKFGEYAFNLSVDDKHIASIPLFLFQKIKTSNPTPITKMHYYSYHIKMQDLRGGMPGFLSKAPKPAIVDGVAHVLVLDETKFPDQTIRMQIKMMGDEIVKPDISRPFTAAEYEQLPQKYKAMLQKNGIVIQAIPSFSAHIKPFSAET